MKLVLYITGTASELIALFATQAIDAEATSIFSNYFKFRPHV